MEKCLHILPMNKLSGAEKMALILCKNIKEYEPLVVCGGEKLKSVFEDAGIKSYTLTFSNYNLINTLSGLKRVIKENNVRILHAHDNIASLNAYLVKKIYSLDVKVISHIHSCYPFLKYNNINKKIDSFFRKRYDHNVVCGKLVYDFYNENANYLENKKTTILSNAIDMDEICKFNISKSEEIRKKFNIPCDKVVLGFIGRICEIKGIIPFIKELAKYKEKFMDCRVLLVGSGEQEQDVKRLIEELDLSELFILTGFQDDVYKFYPLIDIFFLPSLYEGLPMVLLEATAFEKAIVSMDVGSVKELVINNFNGYLIPEYDYSEFLFKLYELKCNSGLIKEFSNNSGKIINEKFNIETYCKKMVEIYNNLNKDIL